MLLTVTFHYVAMPRAIANGYAAAPEPDNMTAYRLRFDDTTICRHTFRRTMMDP